MSDDLSKLMAALSEPVRLKAMQNLWTGQELCVCDLMRRLKMSQSRMSRHMAVLKSAGLVLSRRDAQWIRYKVNPDLSKRIQNVVEAIMMAAKKGVK